MFFEDFPTKSVKEANAFRSVVEKKQRTNPFLELVSNEKVGLNFMPTPSDKIELLIPETAINTKDPVKNTPDFYTKNYITALKNELTLIQLQKEMSLLENFLLYIIVDRKDTPTEELQDLWMSAVKDRLSYFRRPIHQDVYKNFPSYKTEFETTIKYLKENRLWQGPP